MTAQQLPDEECPDCNVMVKIDGKSFRCACGCNVFHHPEPADRSLYQCNGCGERFRGE